MSDSDTSKSVKSEIIGSIENDENSNSEDLNHVDGINGGSCDVSSLPFLFLFFFFLPRTLYYFCP